MSVWLADIRLRLVKRNRMKGNGRGGREREGGRVNVRYAFRMYGTVTMKSVCQMQRPIRGKMPVMRVREIE